MMERTLRKTLLLGFLLLIFTNQAKLASVQKTGLQELQNISRGFSCKEPQLRSYNLRNLTQQHLPGESLKQPVYIVLKRCDSHSGCCYSPAQSCTPLQSAIYQEDMEIQVQSVATTIKRTTWIRVEQHDKCICDVNARKDDPPSIEIL